MHAPPSLYCIHVYHNIPPPPPQVGACVRMCLSLEGRLDHWVAHRRLDVYSLKIY